MLLHSHFFYNYNKMGISKQKIRAILLNIAIFVVVNILMQN